MPALVLTYCAARSPHDQYFFADTPGAWCMARCAPHAGLGQRRAGAQPLAGGLAGLYQHSISAAISEVVEPNGKRRTFLLRHGGEVTESTRSAPLCTQRIGRSWRCCKLT